MSTRLAISALLFMMIQAVLFGIGAVLILATPLQGRAAELMPILVVLTMALSGGASWWLAPRLRSRFWKSSHRLTAGDKFLADIS